MNRRQFFRRTVGTLAAAAVAPDAIRQMATLPAPLPPCLVGTYAGIERSQFAFWHATELLERRLQERLTRNINADLISLGRHHVEAH